MSAPAQSEIPFDEAKSGVASISTCHTGSASNKSKAESVFVSIKNRSNAKPNRTGAPSCCGFRKSKPSSNAVFKPCLVLIRHSERLDYVDKSYSTSEAGKEWPFDAPLTDVGWALARDEAEELADLHEEVNFQVVATSPYRRCVETAVVIAKKLGLPIVLDQEIGEIWESKMGDDPLPWRSGLQLRTMLNDLNFKDVLNPTLPEEGGGFKLFGKRPNFPETLDKGRKRMIVRYEMYIQQSETLKQNMIICSHADGIAAAVSMFERGIADISKMDFCARVIARHNRTNTDGEDTSHYGKLWDVETKGIGITKSDLDKGSERYFEKMHMETVEEHEQMAATRRNKKTKTDKSFEDALVKKISSMSMGDEGADATLDHRASSDSLNIDSEPKIEQPEESPVLAPGLRRI